MESAILLLAVLACPVGMGLMMWFMGKNMKKQDGEGTNPSSVDELRRERERLAADIERLETDEARNGEFAAR